MSIKNFKKIKGDFTPQEIEGGGLQSIFKWRYITPYWVHFVKRTIDGASSWDRYELARFYFCTRKTGNITIRVRFFNNEGDLIDELSGDFSMGKSAISLAPGDLLPFENDSRREGYCMIYSEEEFFVTGTIVEGKAGNKVPRQETSRTIPFIKID